MNFTNFSNNNGAISANISLVNGINEVQLTAISTCGTDTKTYVITFDDSSPNGGPGNSDGTFKQNQQINQNKPTPNNTPIKPTQTPNTDLGGAWTAVGCIKADFSSTLQDTLFRRTAFPYPIALQWKFV